MPIFYMGNLRQTLPRMQWRHGLRAGVAVGVAMAVCRLAHIPMAWAALGALYVSLVDNGGPWRTRRNSMVAVLLPGAFAVLLGSLSGGLGRGGIGLGLAITFLFCFSMTLGRVLEQSIAVSSALVLICYVVAYGDSAHTFAAGAAAAGFYLCGGIWSASLVFLLWPLDPFLPARRAVAAVYRSLQELTQTLVLLHEPDGPKRFDAAIAHTRARIEQAHAALAATPARMTARTVRARNLSVLVESADLVLARILRIAELASEAPGASAAVMHSVAQSAEHSTAHLIAEWLLASLAPVEQALLERPLDVARAFAPDGSHSRNMHRTEPRVVAAFAANANLTPESRVHLAAALDAVLDDTLFNLEICLEAVRAIWTGADPRPNGVLAAAQPDATPHAPLVWFDTLLANVTLRSVMFRYALRLAAVVTVDQLLLRLVHVGHSYWLPMTSLIVLRPYAGETVKRSADRVLGTVLGGILAALLTAVLPSEFALLVVVVVCSAACVALYTVDYAWYCFFVTPAIVLLTRPHLHDWHLAALRAGFTCLGALVAVLAMLLLWPERESLLLPRQLGRGAAADAAYLRAMLVFWKSSAGRQRAERLACEREVLAPARRQCGLTANDAEETLDHALLEHSIPLNPRRSHTASLNSAALTFTTYLRRLTRTTTALAAIGLDRPTLEPAAGAAAEATVSALAARLERVAGVLLGNAPSPSQPPAFAATLQQTLFADHLRRMERQVSVLERTAGEMAAL